MTTLHDPQVVRVNKKSQLVVQGGHPMEEFVVLQDEHGGVHLLPRHFYEEIQQATGELKSAVEDRREYLRKLKAEMPEQKNEGDLSGLVDEVRSFGWLRQLVNRLI
ncbi:MULTISPECIES: hypothetical protein [Mycobacterium]|uniref:Uncharacterized protein n=1 Tax=Mycobacterium kiyosense TaxID=2871094 RepID=A0A9P3Q5B7_9MYCO|nr:MULTISPECIES: hypothetical protein [Mycobacterium]BDB45382.1 hypothetical protein IWGMT90018_58280 [Mycobacterium kiyosense]BDE16846.1 hypothetical protein MKCMC460_57060 [Mycobacterium sp. 20KCMC460]GLB83070.1 hypothetical protein SRL2020028_23260 [Mycobacterium kiyosense]GLB90677.1 hypothetical protein SRL2020130_34940 [Mycobacterium kiyosense]GLB97420.1 hypothetical protein SRL2020226_41960 [Mycobacterium kiyosense]